MTKDKKGKEWEDDKEEINAEEELEPKIESEEETAEGKVADKYLDNWKRCAADFENYKKRQAELQKDMVKYAAQNVVLELIPVLDNFHASTDHIPEDQRNNPWVVGIMHIQKQLEQVLENQGVSAITPNAGDVFDPMFHEAIADINPKKESESANNNVESKNIVKKVICKGYKMGERVIRPARVTVE